MFNSPLAMNSCTDQYGTILSEIDEVTKKKESHKYNKIWKFVCANHCRHVFQLTAMLVGFLHSSQPSSHSLLGFLLLVGLHPSPYKTTLHRQSSTVDHRQRGNMRNQKHGRLPDNLQLLKKKLDLLRLIMLTTSLLS